MSDAHGHSFRYLLWIALTITTLRITYLLISPHDLGIEESQYWYWSQSLDWGYHSKPPLISWVIHLSTMLFGHSEWVIRLFSPITYFFSALCLYRIGNTLFNPSVGFWSGFVFLLAPAVTYSATLMSTDPFLILFWCAALACFVVAIKNNHITSWLWCGIAIGLGLLSKYTMLVFFLSLALYFIFNPSDRRLLKTWGPYCAIIVALLCFLPNIIWNLTHQNAAINHVINHNVNLDGLHFHIKNLMMFMLSQFGILGPIIAILFIAALCWRPHTANKQANILLLSFSLPMLILIMGEALLVRAYGNWAAVAYPSALVFTVAAVWQRQHILWLKISNGLHVLGIVLFCAWELSLGHVTPNWHDFAKQVDQLHQQYADRDYLTDDRELWSKTLYYGKVSLENLFVWDPNHTVDWVDSSGHVTLRKGDRFIFITHRPELPKSLRDCFEHSERVDNMAIARPLREHPNEIYFYRLDNFLG